MRNPTQTLNPVAPEFATTEEAQAYDQWFRAKIAKSLADPRPAIPHEQVVARIQAIIEAATQRQKTV